LDGHNDAGKRFTGPGYIRFPVPAQNRCHNAQAV